MFSMCAYIIGLPIGYQYM